MDERLRTVRKHQLVEVLVDDITKSEFEFPTVENLRGKSVVSIETHADNGASSMTISPKGRDIIASNIAQASFVTLVDCKNSETLNELPYVSLFGRNGGTVRYPQRYIKERVFDIARCKIRVGNTALLVQGEVFLFSFYYED